MAPPKNKSKYQIPWDSLSSEQQAQTRAKEVKQAMNEHRLVAIGRGFGCSICQTPYRGVRNERAAHAAHQSHLSNVKTHLDDRANNAAPDWL